MKRYIVLSVNDDPEYLQYVPLTVWSWRKIGWEPLIFHNGNNDDILKLLHETNDRYHHRMTAEMKSTLYNLKLFDIANQNGYRSDTVTQVSRLYGASVVDANNMVMLGDIDMLALSDYWHPKSDRITIYGHDLTNFQNYPICYAAMTAEKWDYVMDYDDTDITKLIKRDLDTLKQAKSDDFYKRWECDQDLLTRQINKTAIKKEFINRGKIHNGLAQGRIDRGEWSLFHNGNYIDCHQHRELYKIFKKTDRQEIVEKKWREHTAMLQTVWPNENFQWYFDFLEKFAALV